MQRENVKAGLFVLAGIVLCMVVLFLLVDFGELTEDYQTVRVSYPLSDGLRGLKVGSPVSIGHVPIGEVTQIDTLVEQDRATAQVVTFMVPQRLKLAANAQVELDVPPFGSGTKLNIRNVGSGTPYDPSLVLEGYLATNPMVAQAIENTGIGDAERQRIRQIIANVAQITETLRADLPELTRGARRIVERVEPLPAQAGQILAELRATVDDARQIAGKFRDRSDTWFDRIDAITASADASLDRLDTLLRDKDPDLRAIVEQARQLVATLNEQTAPALNATVADARALANDARSLLAAQRPVIERTLADLQLAGTQLKLATVEIRRSPWRLLYRPDRAEIANDNLYDAARSFAMAASALDSAAASLRAMIDAQQADDPRVEQMLTYLNDLFTRFREAEDAFWTQVRQPSP